MDNTTIQDDEMLALGSIYGKDWKTEVGDQRYHSIELVHGSIRVNLCFTIPENYPLMSPPICEMSAPSLNKIEKDRIHDALNEIYIENLGETILYQWIEKVREIIENMEPNIETPCDIEISQSSDMNDIKVDLLKCPNVIHGDVIEDRKSYFQGHVAAIKDKNDVNNVLFTLKKERKIAEATHNILAWRFGPYQDYDDDGEKAAGSRLLHLLELLNLNNVVVVVSRWYGGILLGPNRFRHINNAARQALVKARLINR